ncbi:hypothetical protein [Salirhabdus sp. Marseille-P4669]|uniref:hypothetical protein n=1 Tax=Salirhabdus sp. Marseille-P4669 TaxID=2042310 RepID=UPI000C7CD63B|nr:hypothetical protein [Salirhabdus sp. Marseille-P4669]
MFLKKKKRISELLDTISEMLEVLLDLKSPYKYISDCLIAVDSINFQMKKENEIPEKTIAKLEQMQKSLNLIMTDLNINEGLLSDLKILVLEVKDLIDSEVKTELNIVFFPYKISMWDSLETIYKAAIKDQKCTVHVVPIPYYQLTKGKAIPAYEGNRFPSNVPITHYNDYDLEEQEPDIIYVHNIYDNNNTLTRVFEQYYTANLKKYTDMLVFVPYHSPHFMFMDSDRVSLGYSTPGFKNIDKMIIANDMVKNAAIEDGVSEEKLLVLGSPKLDSMVEQISSETVIPKEWEDRIDGKTVYLINTGCLFFANDPFAALEKLIDIFNIPRYVESSMIIWRPHPLTYVSILQYTPYFSKYFLNLNKNIKGNSSVYKNILIDESDNYLPALKVADILVSTNGSLLRSYILTEKKVIYWAEKLWTSSNLPNSTIPSDVFYYAYDSSEPLHELVKKFSEGYDPLYKNRKGMAAKAYVNTDGTAGLNIHSTISNIVLSEQK